MTNCYIGTKIVAAWPEAKNGAPGYAVRYPDGYQSWCPREEFERCYRVLNPEEREIAFMYGRSQPGTPPTAAPDATEKEG